MPVVSVAFYSMKATIRRSVDVDQGGRSLQPLHLDWTIGHVRSGALGAGRLRLVRCAVLPDPLAVESQKRLTAASSSSTWHFWIATIGIVLYISAMWVSGILQGPDAARLRLRSASLNIPSSNPSRAMHPFYIDIRAAGRGLFLIRCTPIMAYNLWMTNVDRRSQRSSATAFARCSSSYKAGDEEARQCHSGPDIKSSRTVRSSPSSWVSSR